VVSRPFRKVREEDGARSFRDGSQNVKGCPYSLFPIPYSLVPSPWSLVPSPWSLIHRPLREAVPVRLQVYRAKGLLILGKMLTQHVPQSFGLLRAQINELVIADGYLLRAFACGDAKGKLEIPHAYAHLHAVGVGLTIVRGLDDVQLRLLRGWSHGFISLLRCAGLRPVG